MFQADSVRDAAFGCDWVGTPIPFQRCLIFIIATTNKGFQLTAGKFVPVSNVTMMNVCMCLIIYTECFRRNVPNFGRVFLRLKYTDITQNTYIQS